MPERPVADFRHDSGNALDVIDVSFRVTPIFLLRLDTLW
ncbi:hypothetical protein Rcae01_02384 [Novipirellula caenicola]|uniref:Uncharacterized protein n=1 Tax=Novipirellula caenicola TaxID=1536901 RepID=A0ABP9VQI6_9BACT